MLHLKSTESNDLGDKVIEQNTHKVQENLFIDTDILFLLRVQPTRCNVSQLYFFL